MRYSSVLNAWILSHYLLFFSINIGVTLKLNFLLYLLTLFILLTDSRATLRKFYFDESIFIIGLLYAALSIIWTTNYFDSIRGLLALIMLFLGLLSSKFVSGNYSNGILIRSLINVGLTIQILSLSFYFLGFSGVDITGYSRNLGLMYERGMPRMIGTFFDPNFFMMYNVIFLHLGIIYFKIQKGAKGLLILSLLTCILTLSRGGIFGLIVSIFFYSTNIRWKGVGFLGLAYVFYTVVLKNTYVKFLVQKRISDISDGSGRFEMWLDIWPAFITAPQGYGLFTSRSLNRLLNGENLFLHNTYLEILIELGVIGLLIWLAYIFFLLLRVKKSNPKLLPMLISVFVMMTGVSATYSPIWVLLIMITGNIRDEI